MIFTACGVGVCWQVDIVEGVDRILILNYEEQLDGEAPELRAS
jgi:hypothetical protein